MTAVRMLADPSDVAQYASRGDPPMAKWPGRIVETQDLKAANGDRRDWFRYGHRLGAYTRAWHEFRDARRRRRNFHRGFDWNQILILGDYGSGKTTLAIHLARHLFGLGHPVFSNASCLFGWHLEHEEMYTAMGFMPANAVLLIDESSAALASRVGHGVAVSSFNEMNLNTRKKNSIVVYMSAQDWEIAPSIRRNCKEVWMPVADSDLSIEGDTAVWAGKAASNPDNFRLAWHVWDDYPYRKRNLIEGKDPDDTGGFGPPSYTMYDEGENVRRAYLLNDTFELAQAGSATMANRDKVKGALGDFLAGRGPLLPQMPEKPPYIDTIFEYLVARMKEPNWPEWIHAGEIAQATGINSSIIGKEISDGLALQKVRNKGYRTDELFRQVEYVLDAFEKAGGQNGKGS